MAEALRREPRLRFAIYSGARPAWKIPFEYVPYSPGTDVAFVRNLDIGLLPMHDDEFARGKSPIKALQYQACGIPVVGNLVGAANELVDTANGIPVKGANAWTTALVDLARDQIRRRRLGERLLRRRARPKNHVARGDHRAKLSQAGLRLRARAERFCAGDAPSRGDSRPTSVDR